MRSIPKHIPLVQWRCKKCREIIVRYHYQAYPPIGSVAVCPSCEYNNVVKSYTTEYRCVQNLRIV